MFIGKIIQPGPARAVPAFDQFHIDQRRLVDFSFFIFQIRDPESKIPDRFERNDRQCGRLVFPFRRKKTQRGNHFARLRQRVRCQKFLRGW